MITLMKTGACAYGPLGLVRWLLKPPLTLAIHTQEPKMKVVPSSSTAVELMITIEFTRGSSVTLIPAAPAVGVFLASLPRDTIR